VIGRVPFDPAFTKAMVQGKTIVEFDGGSKGCEAVKSIWGNLAQSLEI
jgi:Flp pilus assembly CpaE family ATPase